MRYSLEPKYRKYVQGYGFLQMTKTFRTNMLEHLGTNMVKH